MNAVRPKPIAQRRSGFATALKYLGAAIACIAVTAAAYEARTGYFGLFPQSFEIVSAPAGGRVIKVPAGGNVQAAIDQARSGDVVELQAGAVYSGQIDLRDRPINDFVTIRSSRAAELPAGKRVTPAQRELMAVIQSGMLGRAAVNASNGAHHYRFVGIEFQAAGRLFNYGVVVLGGKETSGAAVPHDIEIDRCYFRTVGSTVSRRAIAVNSANTVIKNSYIEGFAFPGEETQGICGWSGSRNVSILNNYVEGGAENIMFGGADPVSAELTPQDIFVSGNVLNKPEAWRDGPTVKCLFELKNARRVRFTGNLMTNNWKGSAFRITVRNQDGKAPFSTIEDVEISGNVIDGSGDGVNILGKDDAQPSGTLKNLTITNNLFLNIGGKAFEGSGYFIQVADGDNVSITRNTVLNTGNIATFYGAAPRQFSFRDNITGHGLYGIHGIDAAGSGARSMFTGNVFINLSGIGPGDMAFPAGNVMVAGLREVGFVDAASIDLRLSETSRFFSQAGSDVDQKKLRNELAGR